MAQVWFPDETAGWRALPLTGDGFEFNDTGLVPARDTFVSVPSIWRVADAARAEKWVLVSPPGARVRVNAQEVVGGIRALENRDLIQLGDGARLFYTTDTNATVQPLPAMDHKVMCPRCKKEILEGKPVVQCPVCRTYHHQDKTEERCCWTYDKQCSGCDYPTDLALDTRWTPEQL